MGTAEPAQALRALADDAHFVIARIVPDGKGKTDKIPCNYGTGEPCNAHSPANWTTLETAQGCAAFWTATRGQTYRVGRVLTEADDWVCIDLDNARQADKTWHPLAHQVCAALPGAIAELSQSGEGMHLWCRHPNPPPHASKRTDLAIGMEAYHRDRYMVLGDVDVTAPVPVCEALPAFLAEWFPLRIAAAVATHGGGPCAEWSGHAVDDELIAHALRSTGTAAIYNPDGAVTFRDLWECNVDALARKWPSTSGDAFDRSSADASLAFRLAWWTGRDVERIERLMRRSGLARDKHDRPEYMSRTIENACAGTTTVYGQRGAAATVPAVTAAVPATTTTTGAALTFLDLAHGAIPATLDTVYDKLTAKESGVRIALDEFKEEIMIARNGETWARFTDVHYGRLRAEFGRRGFKPIPAEIMKTAVLMASEDHRFDSAKDWANSLQWDGTARIDAALPTYYRTKDTPYTRAVGAYLFTALAARALSPGCQADMVVVLIGLQGERKTSAVRALCPEPDAFAEINLKKIDDDNMARHIRGKLVGEMSELRGLTGRDQESVKAWITRRVEVWRPVYREFETSYPRRLVFIGTSNEREFLDDPTGERRWLPVDAGSADVEGIERDRDQLWAEGIARFRVSGVAWRDAETLARGEHENFKVADPWQDDITQWLDAPVTPAGPPRRASPFKLADVMRGALGKPVANFQRADEKRAAKVLRSLGYEKKNGRDGGSVCKLWTKATP